MSTQAMPNAVDRKLLEQVGRKRFGVHRSLTKLCAVTWKPTVLAHTYFPEGRQLVPLESVCLMVLRRQWTVFPDPATGEEAVWRSTPLMRFNLVLNERCEIRTRRQMAYELAIANPVDRRAFPANQTDLLEFVMRMAATIDNAQRDGNIDTSLPSLPDIYVGFTAENVPDYAPSPYLIAEALTYINNPEHLQKLRLSFTVPNRVFPDWKTFQNVLGVENAEELLQALWVRRKTPHTGGQTLLPQEYLVGREGLNPASKFVDVEPVLGASIESPFPRILREMKIWPHELKSPADEERYRRDCLSALPEERVRQALARAKDLVGPLAEGVQQTDWEIAMANPLSPFTLPRMARIDVLDIHYPSAETMTLIDRGNVYDLFSGLEDTTESSDFEQDPFIPADRERGLGYVPVQTRGSTYVETRETPEPVSGSSN